MKSIIIDVRGTSAPLIMALTLAMLLGTGLGAMSSAVFMVACMAALLTGIMLRGYVRATWTMVAIVCAGWIIGGMLGWFTTDNAISEELLNLPVWAQGLLRVILPPPILLLGAGIYDFAHEVS